MKIIVLAAGQSKRLKPVEDKNFLEFLGKPLIEHQLDQLMALGLQEIFLVGGIHNLEKLTSVAKKLGQSIQVIEQQNLQDGMAGALLSIEKYLQEDEPILVIGANDIVEPEAYQLVVAAAEDPKFESFLLGKKVTKYFPGGYLKTENGLITDIVEKPGQGNEPSDLVNLVVHFHRNSKALLRSLHEVTSTKDDRYEVTLSALIKNGTAMKVVEYEGFWQAVKYPWHILEVMDYFLRSIQEIPTQELFQSSKFSLAPSAIVRGPVLIEPGVKILDHAVIVGPAYIGKNSIIATNSLVRQSMVGENCVIGFGSEIARSLVGNQVWTHTNYVGDSVIGTDCSFGAGTVTGNLRLDEENIRVMIQGEKIDSGRNKFGLVTGKHVRVGINTSFMPGIKIGNNCFIGAGIVVSTDVPDNQLVYAKTDLIMKENKKVIVPRSELNQ